MGDQRPSNNSETRETRTSNGSAPPIPATTAMAATRQERRSSGEPPAYIVIPENHATVTKSHRIIGNTPPPSPPRKKRASFAKKVPKGGDGNNPRGRVTKKSAPKKATRGFFGKIPGLKNLFAVQPKEAVAETPIRVSAEEEFRDAHVISPMWATDYRTPILPPPKKVTKEPIQLDMAVGDYSSGNRSSGEPPVTTGVASGEAGRNSSGEYPADNVANSSGEGFRVSTALAATGSMEMKGREIVDSSASVATGYVNLRRFTTNIVMDPRVVKSRVQFWTKRLYLFWVVLVLSASVLNGFVIYIFHFIPRHIFARDFLYRILLDGSFNYFGIVGVMLSLLVIALWGCAMLTHPSPESIVYQKVRWPFVIAVMIYVAFCTTGQIYECIYLHRDLELAMSRDLRNPVSFELTQLESRTQNYYQCCGIHNYDDWTRYGHLDQTKRSDLKGGYPTTCCNTAFPSCRHRLPVSLRIATGEGVMKVQLWERSCLSAEYGLIVANMCFIIIIEGLCMVAIIGALVLLNIVLKHTNDYSVEHSHPFT